jgi:hypothetical protein
VETVPSSQNYYSAKYCARDEAAYCVLGKNIFFMVDGGSKEAETLQLMQVTY